MIDFGAQNGSENGPKSSPRGSQVALGARLSLEAGFGAMLGSFLTTPEPRKSCSRCGAVLIFAKIAYGAREPKIDPKMSPKSSPKAPPEASTRLKLSIQDGAFFKSNSSSNLGDLGTPKWHQQSLKICFGANWEPPGGLRGLRGPSGSLPEAFGERFSSPECYKNLVKMIPQMTLKDSTNDLK